MVLREDPSSIFSPDVQIENTLGPLSYDVSRVYTGTLEGKFAEKTFHITFVLFFSFFFVVVGCAGALFIILFAYAKNNIKVYTGHKNRAGGNKKMGYILYKCAKPRSY